MNVRLRKAGETDLPAINAVISAAVMAWKLPQRVKRLALPAYLYNDVDLAFLEMWLVIDGSDKVVAVAAWEPVEDANLSVDGDVLLLHGIYVSPPEQGRGLGRLLFARAKRAVSEAGATGLLVKAQEDAVGFFKSQGMQHLTVSDRERHYKNRYWLPLHSRP